MLCRACGMESRTTDVCEWCKKPLAGEANRPAGQPLAGPPTPPPQPLNAPPPLSNAPPPTPHAPPVRVSLTGEVFEASSASAPPAVPMPGGQPLPPTASHPGGLSDLPVGAMAPSLFQVPDEKEAPDPEKWEKFLAMYLPVLALSFLLLHFLPDLFTWVLLGNFFLVGLIMGGTGAIPSYDDAYQDALVALVVGALFGPLTALGVYLLFGLMRQDLNAACVGLMVAALVIRMTLTLTLGKSLQQAFLFEVLLASHFLNLLIIIVNVFGLALLFGGWMLSNFFRPVEAV